MPRGIIEKNQKIFFDFWEVGDVQGISIFCWGTVAEVGLDSGCVGAGYKSHRVPSYDLDTPSDGLDKVIKLKRQKQKFGISQYSVLRQFLDKK